jgi:hypothetical protein
MGSRLTGGECKPSQRTLASRRGKSAAWAEDGPD